MKFAKEIEHGGFIADTISSLDDHLDNPNNEILCYKYKVKCGNCYILPDEDQLLLLSTKPFYYPNMGKILNCLNRFNELFGNPEKISIKTKTSNYITFDNIDNYYLGTINNEDGNKYFIDYLKELGIKTFLEDDLLDNKLITCNAINTIQFNNILSNFNRKYISSFEIEYKDAHLDLNIPNIKFNYISSLLGGVSIASGIYWLGNLPNALESYLLGGTMIGVGILSSINFNFNSLKLTLKEVNNYYLKNSIDIINEFMNRKTSDYITIKGDAKKIANPNILFFLQ